MGCYPFSHDTRRVRCSNRSHSVLLLFKFHLLGILFCDQLIEFLCWHLFDPFAEILVVLSDGEDGIYRTLGGNLTDESSGLLRKHAVFLALFHSSYAVPDAASVDIVTLCHLSSGRSEVGLDIARLYAAHFHAERKHLVGQRHGMLLTAAFVAE